MRANIPVARQSLAAGDAGPAIRPALAPLVGAGDPIDDRREPLLADLARRARLGDRPARDALYAALRPKIERFVTAFQRRAFAAGGPRADGRPLDFDDLAQEAFVVFAETLAAYDGQRPFGQHFLAVFPWRLRDAWRRLIAPARQTIPLAPSHALLDDPSPAADEARLLVETIAADLGEPDSAILCLRMLDGLTLNETAAGLGLSRATVCRRWARIRVTLRRRLAPDDA
ncbi:MAG TPA: sigma-70 family RNA polymerase sigma factor [Thermomicrobiales bacterium]|nr:sigma-70 family RNA polymerase sigma factor [Thermomicrobiales bacterium]